MDDFQEYHKIEKNKNLKKNIDIIIIITIYDLFFKMKILNEIFKYLNISM
jgi:hypothetical protein